VADPGAGRWPHGALQRAGHRIGRAHDQLPVGHVQHAALSGWGGDLAGIACCLQESGAGRS